MMAHGEFGWNELVTPDPDACKAFYGEIVGWTATDVPMPAGGGGTGTYTLWVSGDKQVGGMFRMEGPQFEGVPPHWMAYITVDDVDGACAKVGPAGGQILFPPTDIEGVGRFCVIADPTGAVVSLMTPAPDAS